MSEEEQSPDCCTACCTVCCPCCCPPRDKDDNNFQITIEAYHPPDPEKRFSYPQMKPQTRVQDTAVTSQPKARAAFSASPSPSGASPSAVSPTPEEMPKSESAGQLAHFPGPRARSPQDGGSAASTPTTEIITSGLSEQSRRMPQRIAALEFDIFYRMSRTAVMVNVKRGLHFPRRGFRTINSFVKAILIPSKLQVLSTRVVLNTRSPAYDQILEFGRLTIHQAREQTLLLQIYYHDAKNESHKYVSSCLFQLNDLLLEETHHLVKKINEGAELLELIKGDLLSKNEEIKEMIRYAINIRPELSFSVFYNVQDHVLNVHVKKIERLPTTLPEDVTESFVQVYILPDPTKFKHKQVFTTPIVKRSHEPAYDCMATFRGMSLRDVSEEELVFRIYVNNDVRFLGGVYYPLPPIDKFGDDIVAEIRKFPEEESIMENLKGDLFLTLCYMPEQKILVIKVMEVKLTQSLYRENLNCYVKINLMHEGDRVSKWKTMVKKLNVNSAYKEACKLDLSVISPEEVEIHVLLMSAERFKHNEIGMVKFGREMPEYKTGESQWNESFAKPGKVIANWHPIFPSATPQPAPGQRSGRSRSRSMSPTRLAPGSRSRSRSRSPVFDFLQAHF